MRSSRTPICFMKVSLHITPLTLSRSVLGYGTGAHPLGLNLIKGRRMEKTHFQLGEDEILLSSSVRKTLCKHGRKYPKKTSENSVGRSFDKPSALSCSVSLRDLVLLRGIIRQNADFSFHRLFDPTPSRLCVLEQMVECVPLVMRMLQLLRSFQPFCSFLRLSQTLVQLFNKVSEIVLHKTKS
ncbi:hypothetical protein H5410_056746 [Solanum commersonii]|uniref:Uncharacterized protein n=1 Tax=Solanum commersonii TaxID=4109 RepID=A0A9J5WN60_SOLCO|nr:hypothetical protein H5410_056746 [Solanum commersonii]